MNEPLFEAEKTFRGETNKSLADYLGISEQTFSAKKRNDKRAVFTLTELVLLRRRFNWTDSQFMEIFFPEEIANCMNGMSVNCDEGRMKWQRG